MVVARRAVQARRGEGGVGVARTFGGHLGRVVGAARPLRFIVHRLIHRLHLLKRQVEVVHECCMLTARLASLCLAETV